MNVRLLMLTTVFAASTSGLVARQPPPATTPTTPTTSAAPAAPAITPLGEERRIKPEDIEKYLAEGKTLLLDVREPKELEELGTIEGALNIPIGQLAARLAEVPKDRVILTVCQRGGRASRAASLLEQHGYTTAGFCGLIDYKGKRVHPKAPASDAVR